jgi:NAD(P)H-nitrite reductase large subunit
MGEPLVVIGNGMATVHLVEELAKRALGRFAVAVIGEEPRLAYNRVLLSAVLAQVLFDQGLGTYKKLIVRDARLVGAVLFGDTADGLWYLDLIRSGASIEAIRDDMMFGRALAEREAA